MELGRPDWPEGSILYRGNAPNLRVVRLVEAEDGHQDVLVVEQVQTLVELGERAWIMREALERAKHDLAFLSGCLDTDPATPDETFEVDVSNTVAWITRALDVSSR
jgi:hypothetical protein